jgi:hypothetical protein
MPRLMPWAAVAIIGEVAEAVGSKPETQAELQEFAEGLYPKLVDKAAQLHHIIPKYLGGPTSALNDLVVRIPAAYHQLITNGFRDAWPYGQGVAPSAEQLNEILTTIYTNFPIWRSKDVFTWMVWN